MLDPRTIPALPQPPPRRLFSFSGGGAIGIDKHVGAALALEDSGIPLVGDFVGTSAGAIVAAAAACGIRGNKMAKWVNDIHEEDLIRRRPGSYIPGIRKTFYDHRPIQRFLNQLFPSSWAGVRHGNELAVVTTVAGTGAERWFGISKSREGDESIEGSLADAVRASMTISGVWQYPEILGEWYSDGGTAANLPLPDYWRNYDEVYIICADVPRYQRLKNCNAFERLLHNFSLFLQAQFYATLAEVQSHLAAPLSISQGRHRVNFLPNINQGGAKVFVLHPSADCGGTLKFCHEAIEPARAMVNRQFAEQSFAGRASGHIVDI